VNHYGWGIVLEVAQTQTKPGGLQGRQPLKGKSPWESEGKLLGKEKPTHPPGGVDGCLVFPGDAVLGEESEE